MLNQLNGYEKQVAHVKCVESGVNCLSFPVSGKGIAANYFPLFVTCFVGVYSLSKTGHTYSLIYISVTFLYKID